MPKVSGVISVFLKEIRRHSFPDVVAPCHHDLVEDGEDRADTRASLDVAQREGIAIRRRGDLPAQQDRITLRDEAMREDLVGQLEINIFERRGLVAALSWCAWDACCAERAERRSCIRSA